MKTAKLICCVRTPHDSRDTTASTCDIVVPQTRAVRLAKQIDQFGQSVVPTEYMPTLKPGYRIASGHGVTIAYASGKLQTVRWAD